MVNATSQYPGNHIFHLLSRPIATAIIKLGHVAFWSLSDGPVVALCLLIWYQIMTCDALWRMKAIIPSSINSEITTGKRSFLESITWQEDTMSVHAVPPISLRKSPSRLVHIL